MAPQQQQWHRRCQIQQAVCGVWYIRSRSTRTAPVVRESGISSVDLRAYVPGTGYGTGIIRHV